MAYNFYVLEGRKLVNYKPTAEHYERAIIRMITDDFNCLEDKDKMKRYIFLNVKRIVTEHEKDKTYEQLNNALHFMFGLTDLMGRLTQTEFVQMFPIPKEYDGERWGTKDYFYCIDKLKKYPKSKPLGNEINEFLMEYYNWDIMEFEVEKMCTISEIRRMEGQKGLFEQFAEENVIHLQTFHQEGNEMVDNETGERYEIVKPKNPMRKLFSVV